MSALPSSAARRAGARATGRPAPARRPALRAVPPPAPRSRWLPTRVYASAALVALALGVLGIVALNALAAEASFRARALESAISDATLRHDDLVAEVATLAAPARVREVARSQLGLIEPEQPGFLELDPALLAPTEPNTPVHLGTAAPPVLAQG